MSLRSGTLGAELHAVNCDDESLIAYFTARGWVHLQSQSWDPSIWKDSPEKPNYSISFCLQRNVILRVFDRCFATVLVRKRDGRIVRISAGISK